MIKHNLHPRVIFVILREENGKTRLGIGRQICCCEGAGIASGSTSSFEENKWPPSGCCWNQQTLLVSWQTQTLRCFFKKGEGLSLSMRLCSQWRPTLIAMVCVQKAPHPRRINRRALSKYTDIQAASAGIKEKIKRVLSTIAKICWVVRAALEAYVEAFIWKPLKHLTAPKEWSVFILL